MNRTARLRLQAVGLYQARNILDRVADSTGFTERDITGHSRKEPLVSVRHLAMAAIRRATDLSLSGIGLVFDARHHTTVLHGIRQAEKAAETSPEIESLLVDWSAF
jgi:chromosomal replication initiator protein